METLFFYLFSFLAILGALGTIVLRQPVRALLSLLLAMLALAGLFTLLGAFFVAMVHIIVYAGAVLVLFLFVIMLQGLGAKSEKLGTSFSKIHLSLSLITGLALAGILTGAFSESTVSFLSFQGTVETVGKALFTDFVLPFEMIAVLLLLGIIAAILLAKKNQGETL